MPRIYFDLMMIVLRFIHAVRAIHMWFLFWVIVRIDEGNSTIKTMTFAQLHDNVRRYRAALQHIGVTVGDRVVGNWK